MIENRSRIKDTDSYKVSHYLQYPPGTTAMQSYLESRGCDSDFDFKKSVFFGLQYYLQMLTAQISSNEINDAEKFFTTHLPPTVPFNRKGWERIRDLGYLPIRIRAVPEGSVVPLHNALMTCESTDPETFWLVSWIETKLMRIWYPITVATLSWHIKKDILKYLEMSADDPQCEIGFKLHDFGGRGVSSEESAALGGAAHLVNFMGSDTCVGVNMANEVYGSTMAGFSIPAAEHSTITSWGREGEAEAYENMLDKFARPGSLVAVVSDSYDLFHAIEHIWGGSLRQKVIDSGATVIVRPDSGKDIPQIVLDAHKALAAKFGFHVNKKGYDVLNNTKVIQGDGINRNSINDILEKLTKNKFSATNLAFGMGGALLQKLDRDTLKFAYKCCWIMRNGVSVPVSKDPVTDPGKKSKGGFMDLVDTGEGNWGNMYKTQQNPNGVPFENSLLVPVFENGKILKTWTFEEIRARANDARL